MSFLFWNPAERGPSAEGQGLLCFLGCDKLRSWAHMELIWWGAGKLACILGPGLLCGEEVRAGERERMKPVVKQPSACMSMMGKYAGWIQPGNSTGPGGQDTCCWHPSRNEHGTGESMREEGEGTVFLAEGTAMGKGLEVGTS